MLAEGQLSQVEIGRRFGVSNYIVYSIKAGRAHKNVR